MVKVFEGKTQEEWYIQPVEREGLEAGHSLRSIWPMFLVYVLVLSSPVKEQGIGLSDPYRSLFREGQYFMRNSIIT